MNRVSLGAQSFQPRLLEVLERAAGPDDVRRAVHTLRDAGFDNISLDLIYGIPGQSAADLEARPRRGARARARAPLLLRARGEAGNALHARARRGARAPGGGDGGLLRAGRRDADRRRLPLVRDGELLPRRRRRRELRARHNLGDWRGARLPRGRGRRGLDARRRAPAEPAGAGAVRRPRSAPARSRRARSSSSTRETHARERLHARAAARRAARARRGRRCRRRRRRSRRSTGSSRRAGRRARRGDGDPR